MITRRNDICRLIKVSNFFNEKYDGKYLIINVSERATYDKEKYFQGRVLDFHWPDHHGPPFTFLFTIAEQAYKWIIGRCTLS